MAETLGRYRIIRELGKGGMGTVYEVVDPNLQRRVALKIISQPVASERERKRFEREASLMAKLDHPNIVKIFDVGEEGGRLFFTMEFVDGCSFQELMKDKPLPQLIRILIQAAHAVHYAHQAGIVHRDLKPSNIMITRDGQPKVMDFGLAKELGEKGPKLSRSVDILGTPQYMSPEQVNGRIRDIDARSDVYALGAILYEMLVGHPPFTGTAMSILYKINAEEPKPPSRFYPRIARDLETICLKALEKDKLKRYPNALEFAEELERYLQGDLIRGRPVGCIYKFWKWMLRKRLQAAAVGVALLALPVSIYWWWLAPGILVVVPQNAATGAKLAVPLALTLNEKKCAGKPDTALALSPGKYMVTVKADGYDPRTECFEIRPRKETKWVTPLLRSQGKLTVTSSSGEIQVSLQRNASDTGVEVLAPVHDYPLDTGEYRMRLQKENHFHQEAKISIKAGERVQYHARLQSMLLWQKEITSASPLTHMALADTDRDGRMELLCFCRSGRVQAYDVESHEKLWQISYNLPESVPYRPFFQDWDKDGFVDFVLPQHHCLLVIDGKTHQEIFRVPVYWGRSFALADANSDGYDDLIAFAYHSLQCHDMYKRQLLWEVPGHIDIACMPLELDPTHLLYGKAGKLYRLDITTGRQEVFFSYGQQNPTAMDMVTVQGKRFVVVASQERAVFCLDVTTRRIVWEWTNPDPPSVPEAFTIADVNNDGKPEILIPLENLYCLDAQDGQEIWRFPTKSKIAGRGLAVADLDLDKIPEVMVPLENGVLCFVKGRTRELISQFVCKRDILTVKPFDVNGDGKLEALLLSGNDIYCIRHQPADAIKIWEQNHLLARLPLAAADLNQDNYQELILTSAGKEVYCLHGRTGDVMWRYPTARPLIYQAVVADVQGDGVPEIIIHAGDYGVTVLSAQGQRLWEFKIDTGPANSAPLVADVNNDGLPEILTHSGHQGQLYCMEGKTGKELWRSQAERLFVRPKLADVDKDGFLELLILGGLTYLNGRSGHGMVYCFCGQNGSRKWTSQIPSFSEGSTELGLADLNHDGCEEIIVPQVGGHVSCLDGKTGQCYWDTRVRGGDVCGIPVMQDVDGDGFMEIIVTTANEDVYCLRARDAEVKWSVLVSPNPGTAIDTDLKRYNNTRLLCLNKDLDADGVPDLLVLTSQHSFYLLSGRTGAWLGHTDEFGPIHAPLLTDMDGDNRLDLVFVDSLDRVVEIKNVEEFWRRLIQFPQAFTNDFQDANLQRLAYCERLLTNRAYARLADFVSQQQQYFSTREFLPKFYQDVAAVARKETITGNGSAMLQPRFTDARFLQLLIHGNAGRWQEAVPVMHELLKNSVIDFQRLSRQYGHLLTTTAREKWQEVLPTLIEKTRCDVPLYSAYYLVRLSNQRDDANRLLELALQYGQPSREEYKSCHRDYLEHISGMLRQVNTFYNNHDKLEILDHAIDVLPKDPVLLYQRAHWYFTFRFTKQGLEDVNRILRINPESVDALYLRGQIHYLDGRYPYALDDFNSCSHLQSDRLEFYLWRITTHLALKQNAIAVGELEKLCKQTAMPGSMPGAELIQVLQWATSGKKQEARQKLQQLVPKTDAELQLLQAIAAILNN